MEQAEKYVRGHVTQSRAGGPLGSGFPVPKVPLLPCLPASGKGQKKSPSMEEAGEAGDSGT